jgi:hypothetical protein
LSGVVVLYNPVLKGAKDGALMNNMAGLKIKELGSR